MKAMQRFFCFVIISILSVFVLSFYAIPVSAYTRIRAEIPVECLEIPDSETHLYRIMIQSDNEISPAPKSDLLEITENGTGIFEIDIDEPGTFTYRISEQPGTEDNIRYDTNVYSVTVFVEDLSDAKLHYAVTAKILGREGKQERIVFQNLLEEGVLTTTATTALSETEPTTVSSADLTTTVTTTATTAPPPKSIIQYIGNVMTGDFTPIGMLLILLTCATAVAVLTVTLRRRKNEQ